MIHMIPTKKKINEWSRCTGHVVAPVQEKHSQLPHITSLLNYRYKGAAGVKGHLDCGSLGQEGF